MMPALAVGVAVAAAAWFVARPLLAGTGDARAVPSRRPTVVVAALVTAAVCAGVLMARAVAPAASGPATGAGAAAGAAAAGAAAAPAPAASPTAPPQTPSADDGQQPSSATPAPTPLSDEQLAAVNSALSRVRDQPRNAAAHLDLARAYADADQPQLSAVEYLAVVRLDKTNPEANTALALVALGAGQPKEGKRLVDAVLAAHPRYPDALYTRGLIYLMGLRQAAPGIRDLKAYLAAAPYGAHRSAAETLLAMVSDGRRP